MTPAASQGNVTYQITGPLVVYQNPPRSKAEAAEHARTFADEFDQRIHAHLCLGLLPRRLPQGSQWPNSSSNSADVP